MHTLVYWTKFLRANENVASLCHAVVGVCQHSWWPKPKASSGTESWCLSGSLVSGPSLTGNFRLLQTSGAWFSELDCNQLDINCQFQQQLTSTNYLHYGRWSFLTKKYNSAFWTLDSSTSWIVWVAAVFRWRDMAFLEHEGSSLGFLSQMPLWSCAPAIGNYWGWSVCTGSCFLARQVVWSWMVGFSVDLKYQGFSKCLQIHCLCWQVFE